MFPCSAPARRLALVAAAFVVGAGATATTPSAAAASGSAPGAPASPAAHSATLRPLAGVAPAPVTGGALHAALPAHPRAPWRGTPVSSQTPVAEYSSALALRGSSSSAHVVNGGAVLQGFEGASHDADLTSVGSDQNLTPPGANLAVSSTQVAEVVNSALWVFDRSGSLQFTADLETLIPGCVAAQPTDPRIAYDPLANRWFLSATEYAAAQGPSAASSCVVIMVTKAGTLAASQTGWYAYGAGWHPTPEGLLYDQPKLGFSADKVVVSWNDFPCATCNLYGAETWVIDKAELLAGQVPHTTVFGPDASRFAIVPVESLSSTSDEWAVYNDSDRTDLVENTGSPRLGVIRISGTPSAGNVAWTEYDPGMPATSPPYYVSQSGSTWLVQTDDDRLLDASFMNGLIWTAANEQCGKSDSCARFIEAQATPGSVQVMPGQDWDLGGDGTNFYYPSVTFDGAGDMVGSVNVSTSSTDPAVDVVAQAQGYAVQPTLLTQVQSSSLPYTDPIGRDAYGGERWGDYAGAAFDPADSHGAWVAGEYVAANALVSSSNDNWASWLGDVEASGPQSGISAPGGGYVLDGYGGVHPVGDSPPVAINGYWPGWNIARAIAMNPCDTSGQISGWVMDGYGGLHPFAAAGTPMPAVPDITGYWGGWSIANDFVAWCDQTTHTPEGCTLDGFGGLHPWADTATDLKNNNVTCQGSGYWPGWDVATKISVIPGSTTGYVMDGFGGLHPFAAQGATMPSTPTNEAYWPNDPIARDVLATANGGYTIDGYGGVHPFGSAPVLNNFAYWPGFDIARAVDLAAGGAGIYTLDGYGMVHPGGGAPFLSVSAYWPGNDLACDFISAP